MLLNVDVTVFQMTPAAVNMIVSACTVYGKVRRILNNLRNVESYLLFA